MRKLISIIALYAAFFTLDATLIVLTVIKIYLPGEALASVIASVVLLVAFGTFFLAGIISFIDAIKFWKLQTKVDRKIDRAKREVSLMLEAELERVKRRRQNKKPWCTTIVTKSRKLGHFNVVNTKTGEIVEDIAAEMWLRKT